MVEKKVPLPLSALRPLPPGAPGPEEVQEERNSWFSGELKASEASVIFETQKLRRITQKDRKRITLASSVNRRRRQWIEREQEARQGLQACRHCGVEPCGFLWPEARCCRRCTHESMRHWQLTHVLWLRGKPYYVMEVNTGPAFKLESDDFSEGHPGRREREKREKGRQETRDAIYYRPDGVIQWVRRARTHYFLGARVSVVDFTRHLPTALDVERFEHVLEDPDFIEQSLIERSREEDASEREVETIDPNEEEEEDE